MICGMLALGVMAAAQGEYLRPGTEEVGGVRDMVLIYHGMERRVDWTSEAIMPYVAHVDEDGEPQDWLFDSFLFIEFSTDDGTMLNHAAKDAKLPELADWQWLADAWFRDDTGLVGLEEAVAEAGAALGDPEHVVNVVIALPTPLREITDFGRAGDEERPQAGMPAPRGLDFSEEEDRREAVAWYIDEVMRNWKARSFEHLNLAGFYWLAENIPSQDADIVGWTGDCVRDMGMKLYFIPYFGGGGATNWREIGLDATMLQPNHFFMSEADDQRLLAAAKIARMAGTGIEIEFDGRALDRGEHTRRFWAYLDAGVKYGWMDEALLGYYEGGGAVKMFAEREGLGREMYDALHEFVKGTYTPSGKVDLAELDFVERDNSGNLALADKGAQIIGCVRLDDQPELTPEEIIDGNVDLYGGMNGFGYFAWPGSFTIELPKTETVARTQVMLFDLDGRHFRYRVDTSVDGETWEPAVDKSEGDWVGWQVDRFEPRQARQVRFTGLHNSVNGLFQVVEFEVYPSHQ